jgi:hypothetical protein
MQVIVTMMVKEIYQMGSCDLTSIYRKNPFKPMIAAQILPTTHITMKNFTHRMTLADSSPWDLSKIMCEPTKFITTSTNLTSSTDCVHSTISMSSL